MNFSTPYTSRGSTLPGNLEKLDQRLNEIYTSVEVYVKHILHMKPIEARWRKAP